MAIKIKEFKTNRDKPDGFHQGKKCVMLAHGESGHAHAFYGEDTVEYNSDTGKLNVKSPDSLAHEEHTKHDFDLGTGEVTIQREYSLGDMRKVVD